MKPIETMDVMKIISELDTIELDKLYDQIILDVSDRILHKVGGNFKKTAKKVGTTDTTLNYAIQTNNFKTKIRMLARLEVSNE